MWQTKRFNKLTVTDLYQILALRVQIFVVDQKRIYQDPDGQEQKAIHIFNRDEDGDVVAYARVFLNGNEVSFGRVVTSNKVEDKDSAVSCWIKLCKQSSKNFLISQLKLRLRSKLKIFINESVLLVRVSRLFIKLRPILRWCMRRCSYFNSTVERFLSLNKRQKAIMLRTAIDQKDQWKP